MLIWPSPASSQTSGTCAFGELAYTMRNVKPDAQEVVVNKFTDFKLQGTVRRVLIKQHADGSLDYTLCWTASKPTSTTAPAIAAIILLVAIALSCAFVYWLKKRPEKVVIVELV